MLICTRGRWEEFFQIFVQHSQGFAYKTVKKTAPCGILILDGKSYPAKKTPGFV